MRTNTITLRSPLRSTRSQLPAASLTLRRMRTPAPAVLPDLAVEDAQAARIKQLEAEVEAANLKLHTHASQVWLEVEDRLAVESKQRLAERQHCKETKTAHVRDNTPGFQTPAVVATTDAVHLRLPLDPRKAIPMKLPVMSLIRNWLHLKW